MFTARLVHDFSLPYAVAFFRDKSFRRRVRHPMGVYPDNVGHLVAERTLVLKESTGVRRNVVVRLGKPEPDGDDWACSFQILGLERERGLRVMGVDAFQALLLAVKALAVNLEAEAKRVGGNFCWLGQATSGFPISQGKKSTVEW